MSNEYTKQRVRAKRQRNYIAKELLTDRRYRPKRVSKKLLDEEVFDARKVLKGVLDND